MLSRIPLKLFLCLLLLVSACKKQDSSSTKKQTKSGGAGKDKTQTKKTGDSSAGKGGNQKKKDENTKIDFEFALRRNTGIDFVHNSGFDDKRVFPAANGSGIGVIDFDRDGFQDLFFGSGKHFPIVDESKTPSQLFRNLGNWQFENCTEQASAIENGYASGIAIGDIDNDGFQDFYVGCYGENSLYLNLGDGSFEKISGDGLPGGKPTRPEGLDPNIPDTPGWAASVAFLDFNNDGNLDIYVGNYGIWNLQLKNNCGDKEKNEPRFCSPTTVRPQGDVLYLSNGDGTFSDTSKAAGIYSYVKGKNEQVVRQDYRTQGVIVSDFNNDGWVDIYCGNDMQANLLLVNNGKGAFENKTELSSTGYGPNGNSLASMGVAAGDANNDGFMDLFCTNFSNEFNSFYKGMGDLQFAEVSKRNRLVDGARPWVGWGTEFIDLDGDGWMEVIVTNGHVDPNIVVFEPGQEHLQPCLIWKNEKGRFRLANVDCEYFDQKHPGRALAIADLDNDGDQDFVVGHQDRKPALLENKIKPLSSDAFVTLKLIGTRSNRDGIGTRFKFRFEQRELFSVLIGGGSYLSTHSPAIRETRWLPDEQAELLWPSGTISSLGNREKRDQAPIYVIEQPVED